ncbi:DUF2259 domain-containing protein [Stigmatella sp. ncwal1]|uniref:DUF2259 domain-containing protein n=1 Tax=Stigmatella ashevillensis TaxID=2995309 RepID=A0ABT5DM26_9BACT|nr:DUF2259 domain-containing protein [Stigmatella ashevillena]MDC0713778.1 DUF2259 domain-containing protein [Stigmatella ashevillena]
MKKLVKALIIALATVGASHAAWATDAKNFRNLGFSADGRHFAFAESVVQDPSGFPWAAAYVVDVAQNRLVQTEKILIEVENRSEEKALQQVIAKLNLSKYGIDQKRLGKTLWIRMPTDLGAPEMKPLFSLDYGVMGGANTVSPQFQLEVTELDPAVPNTECEGYGHKMVAVSLANLGDDTRVDLQRDTNVPRSRECSWAYQPRQVIEHKGSIVVVLRYETFGFEGPDYNHMVVTAQRALERITHP